MPWLRDSFPTRRSSDLIHWQNRGNHQDPSAHPGYVQFPPEVSPLSHTLPHLQQYVKERSEEHTSELQSRGHLVCRLLLEKKQAVLRRDLTCEHVSPMPT